MIHWTNYLVLQKSCAYSVKYCKYAMLNCPVLQSYSLKYVQIRNHMLNYLPSDTFIYFTNYPVAQSHIVQPVQCQIIHWAVYTLTQSYIFTIHTVTPSYTVQSTQWHSHTFYNLSSDTVVHCTIYPVTQSYNIKYI